MKNSKFVLFSIKYPFWQLFYIAITTILAAVASNIMR